MRNKSMAENDGMEKYEKDKDKCWGSSNMKALGTWEDFERRRWNIKSTWRGWDVGRARSMNIHEYPRNIPNQAVRNLIQLQMSLFVIRALDQWPSNFQSSFQQKRFYDGMVRRCGADLAIWR